MPNTYDSAHPENHDDAFERPVMVKCGKPYDAQFGTVKLTPLPRILPPTSSSPLSTAQEENEVKASFIPTVTSWHEFALPPDVDIGEKMEKGVIYFSMDKTDETRLSYSFIDPTSKSTVISDKIDISEIEGFNPQQPFILDQLKPFKKCILEIMAKRGHALAGRQLADGGYVLPNQEVSIAYIQSLADSDKIIGTAMLNYAKSQSSRSKISLAKRRQADDESTAVKPEVVISDFSNATLQDIHTRYPLVLISFESDLIDLDVLYHLSKENEGAPILINRNGKLDIYGYSEEEDGWKLQALDVAVMAQLEFPSVGYSQRLESENVPALVYEEIKNKKAHDDKNQETRDLQYIIKEILLGHDVIVDMVRPSSNEPEGKTLVTCGGVEYNITEILKVANLNRVDLNQSDMNCYADLALLSEVKCKLQHPLVTDAVTGKTINGTAPVYAVKIYKIDPPFSESAIQALNIKEPAYIQCGKSLFYSACNHELSEVQVYNKRKTKEFLQARDNGAILGQSQLLELVTVTGHRACLEDIKQDAEKYYRQRVRDFKVKNPKSRLDELSFGEMLGLNFYSTNAYAACNMLLRNDTKMYSTESQFKDDKGMPYAPNIFADGANVVKELLIGFAVANHAINHGLEATGSVWRFESLAFDLYELKTKTPLILATINQNKPLDHDELFAISNNNGGYPILFQHNKLFYLFGKTPKGWGVTTLDKQVIGDAQIAFPAEGMVRLSKSGGVAETVYNEINNKQAHEHYFTELGITSTAFAESDFINNKLRGFKPIEGKISCVEVFNQAKGIHMTPFAAIQGENEKVMRRGKVKYADQNVTAEGVHILSASQLCADPRFQRNYQFVKRSQHGRYAQQTSITETLLGRSSQAESLPIVEKKKSLRKRMSEMSESAKSFASTETKRAAVLNKGKIVSDIIPVNDIHIVDPTPQSDYPPEFHVFHVNTYVNTEAKNTWMPTVPGMKVYSKDRADELMAKYEPAKDGQSLSCSANQLELSVTPVQIARSYSNHHNVHGPAFENYVKMNESDRVVIGEKSKANKIKNTQPAVDQSSKVVHEKMVQDQVHPIKTKKSRRRTVNKYSMVLMAVENASLLDMDMLKQLSRHNDHKPVLINCKGEVYIYGFSALSQSWKMTQLNPASFNHLDFPKSGETVAISSKNITTAMFEEIELRNGHLPQNKQTKQLEYLIRHIMTGDNVAISAIKPKDGSQSYFEVRHKGVTYNLTKIIKKANINQINLSKNDLDMASNFLFKMLPTYKLSLDYAKQFECKFVKISAPITDEKIESYRVDGPIYILCDDQLYYVNHDNQLSTVGRLDINSSDLAFIAEAKVDMAFPLDTESLDHIRDATGHQQAIDDMQKRLQDQFKDNIAEYKKQHPMSKLDRLHPAELWSLNLYSTDFHQPCNMLFRGDPEIFSGRKIYKSGVVNHVQEDTNNIKNILVGFVLANHAINNNLEKVAAVQRFDSLNSDLLYQKTQYDLVLIALPAGKKINMHKLQRLSEQNGMKPVLVRWGDHVIMYGNAGGRWKLTAMDASLFSRLTFPDSGKVSIAGKDDITKPMRDEVSSKKAHQHLFQELGLTSTAYADSSIIDDYFDRKAVTKVCAIAPDAEINLATIKERSEYNKIPVLVRHGDKVYIYGSADSKEWKLTELDGSVLEMMEFPPQGSNVNPILIPMKVRDEVMKKNGHDYAPVLLILKDVEGLDIGPITAAHGENEIILAQRKIKYTEQRHLGAIRTMIGEFPSDDSPPIPKTTVEQSTVSVEMGAVSNSIPNKSENKTPVNSEVFYAEKTSLNQQRTVGKVQQQKVENQGNQSVSLPVTSKSVAVLNGIVIDKKYLDEVKLDTVTVAINKLIFPLTYNIDASLVEEPSATSTNKPAFDPVVYKIKLDVDREVASVLDKANGRARLNVCYDKNIEYTPDEYAEWAKIDIERFMLHSGSTSIVLFGELPVQYINAVKQYCVDHSDKNIKLQDNTKKSKEPVSISAALPTGTHAAATTSTATRVERPALDTLVAGTVSSNVEFSRVDAPYVRGHQQVEYTAEQGASSLLGTVFSAVTSALTWFAEYIFGRAGNDSQRLTQNKEQDSSVKSQIGHAKYKNIYHKVHPVSTLHEAKVNDVIRQLHARLDKLDQYDSKTRADLINEIDDELLKLRLNILHASLSDGRKDGLNRKVRLLQERIANGKRVSTSITRAPQNKYKYRSSVFGGSRKYSGNVAKHTNDAAHTGINLAHHEIVQEYHDLHQRFMSNDGNPASMLNIKNSLNMLHDKVLLSSMGEENRASLLRGIAELQAEIHKEMLNHERAYSSTGPRQNSD